MLIYSKKTDAGIKLYGTLADVPSDDDQELVYKNAETGTTVTIVEGGAYVTFSDDGIAHVQRLEDDGTKTDLSVYIGDTLVVGKEAAAEEAGDEASAESEETVEETTAEAEEPAAE